MFSLRSILKCCTIRNKVMIYRCSWRCCCVRSLSLPPLSLYVFIMCVPIKSVCVCVCVFDCASMCQHCTSQCVCLPMPVCVCVCVRVCVNGSCFSEKGIGREREKWRNLISQSGSRLAGWVGCGGWGRAVTTEGRRAFFFFWLATQRPITIHKQTKTTLYTNDPGCVCVCVSVCVCVCVWKEGEK